MTIKKSHKNNKKGVIYKYLFPNGKVAYVGKTMRPLQQRIEEHCKELKFYGLNNIEYYETTMTDDIFKHENYWINYYKPMLNESMPNANKGLKKMPRNKWKKYNEKVTYEKPIGLSLMEMGVL